eukprot:TRINITY_DN4490_c0_g3_i1.p2 TRINITY_DN4490_c0_g3~~TRINITY_DN4490_c0_g3_i1.p2  ORF type:complete len:298 (-),score=84.58 TRINITY_DN4490_c0_g3_i1:1064-1957(-)
MAAKVPEKKDNPILRGGLAGISSMIAGFTLHPVDTCKVRMQKQGEAGTGASAAKRLNLFQTFRYVIQTEGVRALYKGLIASQFRDLFYSSLRLGLYEPFKQLLGEKDPKTTPYWKKFVSGGMSGGLASAIANPLDLLKVRLQASESHHKSIVGEIRTIYETAGFWGFYRGTLPTVTRAIILNAVKLSTYDHIKHTLINLGFAKEGLGLQFVASFSAGLLMTITTAPVDLVKTRLMSQPNDAKVYNGMIDCALKSVRNEGVLSLYKGFLAQWMRFGPFTIIQLMVWEKLRSLAGMRSI